MKKREEALLSRPNETMWQLAHYSLTEPIPILHYRLATVPFEKIDNKVLYAPEFSAFDTKWRKRTKRYLQGKTLSMVIPSLYLHVDLVKIFVLLPKVGEQTVKKHWGRETLLLSLDTEFLTSALVKTR